MLNNVYMLGGVTDATELETIMARARYPLSVYNLYTGRDMVLTHVLALCLPNNRPIGITKLKSVLGHETLNMDVSDFVSGHLAYMSEFDAIGKALWMNRE